MATVGIGVDILEVARMERAMERTPRILEKVFTDEERAYCDAAPRPAESYAGRFCAREAVLKALGVGFSEGIGLKDVSVVIDEKGMPKVVLAGRAAEVAEKQGVREVALSISHTHDVAVANAVAVTDEARPHKEERVSAEQAMRASFREARSVLDEIDGLERARDRVEAEANTETGVKGSSGNATEVRTVGEDILVRSAAS